MTQAAHIRYQSKLFFGSSHSWALEKLAQLSAQSTVLDIGPGSGVIGKWLHSQGFSNNTAIEIDPAAKEHVRPFYQQVLSSLDELNKQQFDAIILLDVLEHMAEPEKFLQCAVNYLKPGGFILISVPNIAHWSVRFQLLFGFFEYTNRGLLDRTHLQFFNRRRARRLNQHIPTLKAIEYDSSIEPLELLFPEVITASSLFKLISRVRLTVARALPGLCAFQHLCYLQKNAR
jgi:2-polyprenyl-3-methyl-5-hydroxy-6-metoxy-1,4-benzoquinol methylase